MNTKNGPMSPDAAEMNAYWERKHLPQPTPTQWKDLSSRLEEVARECTWHGLPGWATQLRSMADHARRESEE